MKAVLHLVLLISMFAFNIEKSNAQCVVSEIVIQNIKQIASTPNSCTIKFDVTFNIESNNGNKLIFIHGWSESNYPDYFKCVNGRTTLNGSIAAPTTADLGNTYFNIGLDNTNTNPVVLTTYPADPSVTMSQMDSVNKILLPDGSVNFTLYGVTATSNSACGTPEIIEMDLWSSQSSNGSRAHCVNCGIRYSDGYLNASGFVNCNSLNYGGTITNRTNILIDGYYRVFVDVNGDGYFTPTTDTLIQGNTSFSVGPFGSQSISGAVPAANLNQNVFIVITQLTGDASGASRVFLFPSTLCSPLPVTFGFFSATRINPTKVSLRWETVTELNNSGFYIEKNIGNNYWGIVTFINTQAPGGTSTNSLQYTYNDINTNKGITQYRIKQLDIDGKVKFSEIRAVRGDEQKSKIIVYPNPSNDGRVNIVFEDQEGTRDVTITDMSGRIMQQWNAVRNNTLQIQNLNSGLFILRVTIKETGIRSAEKIVITKY